MSDMKSAFSSTLPTAFDMRVSQIYVGDDGEGGGGVSLVSSTLFGAIMQFLVPTCAGNRMITAEKVELAILNVK